MNRQTTILVVDDEQDVRDLIAYVLDLQGYSVITAASGEEALAVVRLHSADMVICDIKMPGMDGVEITRRLKELAPALPIVIVTGFFSEETQAACHEGGASAYVQKLNDAAAESLLESVGTCSLRRYGPARFVAAPGAARFLARVGA